MSLDILYTFGRVSRAGGEGDARGSQDAHRTGSGILIFLVAEFNINLDGFRKHLPAPNPRLALFIYLGLALLAVGGFRLFNWLLVAWSQRKTKEDREPR